MRKTTRWDTQTLDAEDVLPGLDRPGLERAGVVRTVRTPEFAGIAFHEVLAKSALSHVPRASQMPFGWTINPYRGCSHRCTYCFARDTHRYLDLDAGDDFDRQIVVKVNVAQVLEAELRRPSWAREHVALGTNTDPYQRAEGRYGLMPGIVAALHRSRTPFSVLTKGTLLRRDLPALAAAAEHVPVSVGVSIAVLDDALQRSVEPGTPTARARLELVRAVREAGLPCHVMVAPVLPWLTDSRAHLDALLAAAAEAGAQRATVLALHLRPGAREWYLGWLAREQPHLVDGYRRVYGDRAYASRDYHEWLRDRVDPLLRRHGLDGRREPPELHRWGAAARPATAGAAPAAGAAAAVGPAGDVGPTLF